jgi:hypothetical protein
MPSTTVHINLGTALHINPAPSLLFLCPLLFCLFLSLDINSKFQQQLFALPSRDDVKVVGLGKNKEKPNFAYLRFLGEPTVRIVECQYLKYVRLFLSQCFLRDYPLL